MPNDAIKKIKWARKLVWLVVVALIAVLGSMYLSAVRSDELQVRINNRVVRAELADTSAERERGLCCRDSIGEDSGMLFIYDQPGNYRFWMKDTRIPLDMYWISNEKKIVHIQKNVQPSTFPKTFGTDKPAQYVLETSAGFANKHGVEVGDKVEF